MRRSLLAAAILAFGSSGGFALLIGVCAQNLRFPGRLVYSTVGGCLLCSAYPFIWTWVASARRCERPLPERRTERLPFAPPGETG